MTFEVTACPTADDVAKVDAAEWPAWISPQDMMGNMPLSISSPPPLLDSKKDFWFDICHDSKTLESDSQDVLDEGGCNMESGDSSDWTNMLYSCVGQEVELRREYDMGPSRCDSATEELIPAQSLSDQGKLVVVLDLDETLVRFRDGPIYWRPHFDTFLDAIKDVCEVVLWTASTEDCAARVMPVLDPNGDRLHHRVYRNPIWFKGVPYTKDLTLLNRDMSRVVIIENTLQCVWSNPSNAVLVEDYVRPNSEDTALLVVMNIVLEMARDMEKSVPVHLSLTSDTDNICAWNDGLEQICHVVSPTAMNRELEKQCSTEAETLAA